MQIFILVNVFNKAVVFLWHGAMVFGVCVISRCWAGYQNDAACEGTCSCSEKASRAIVMFGVLSNTG